MTETRVVNIRNEGCDVFIGRPSKFGNPFKIGRDGTREQVITKFGAWARLRVKTDSTWAEHVKSLAGKTLGCYCAPLACHGDVLRKLAIELNSKHGARD